MSRRIHVIPVGGDEPLHICGQSCWCYPITDSDGVVGHNAKDLRDALERNGVDRPPGRVWVMIEEEVR